MKNKSLYYSKCHELAYLYRQSSAVLVSLPEMVVESTEVWANLVILSNIFANAQLHYNGNCGVMTVIFLVWASLQGHA